MLIILILIIGLLVFSCGPNVQEKLAANIIDDVVGGVTNALYSNMNFATGPMKVLNSRSKQEGDDIVLDFDDPNFDLNDIAEGQITLSLIQEPQFKNDISLGDGFSTPFEDLDIDETTGEVTPIFPASSPISWESVNNQIEFDESYAYNLIGINPDATPPDTLIELNSSEINGVISSVNSDIITSGNPLGAEVKFSITYANFRIKKGDNMMDNSITGTVEYTVSVGMGFRLESNYSSNSFIDIDMSYPDSSSDVPTLNLTGSLTPGFRIGVELDIDSTGLILTPVDTTQQPKTVDIDVNATGNFTVLITQSGTIKVEEISGEPKLTVENFDVKSETKNSVSVSGSVIVDGENVNPSFAQPIVKLMYPLYDALNTLKENINEFVNMINGSF
jgi:hypothetical protein